MIHQMRSLSLSDGCCTTKTLTALWDTSASLQKKVICNPMIPDQGRMLSEPISSTATLTPVCATLGVLVPTLNFGLQRNETMAQDDNNNNIFTFLALLSFALSRKFVSHGEKTWLAIGFVESLAGGRAGKLCKETVFASEDGEGICLISSRLLRIENQCGGLSKAQLVALINN